MLLSGSIYSWNNLSPLKASQKLEAMGVDCFHIDCNDDVTVFEDIESIKAQSRTPIDLHLITATPQCYYDAIQNTGVETCCFQYENLTEPLVIPEDMDCRLGLAITMETPISVFEQYKDRFAFILLMTTTPGMSGGAFNDKVFQRIREFKEKYPSKAIHVDGGVTDEVSFMLRSHGVKLIVVGSYLEKASSIINSTLLIRGHDAEKSKYLVRDFMQFPKEFPVLLQKNLNLQAVLREMSSRRSGFAAVIDDNTILLGIITDGDIRRAWLKSLESGNEAKIQDILNISPQTILESATVGNMLEHISTQSKTCLYLPVVDKNNKLRGAISFQDLMKGGI